MASLANHSSSQITKLLLIGDSGAGKTGALASLVKAGYKLRILDFDNGLDILRLVVGRDAKDKLGNVEYRYLRDKYKSSDLGPILDGAPKAFTTAVKMLDKWTYTDDDGKPVDFGNPSTWGPEVILVLDSLTFLSEAAFNWAEMMQASSKNQDRRQIFYVAQQKIEAILAMLSGKPFNTNVIVTAHIRYSTKDDGTMKGFPNAIGSALGPTIPAYFNSMALVTKTGSSGDIKRVIQTASTSLLDLKNPAPFSMEASLPLETGLATFFAKVRA